MEVYKDFLMDLYEIELHKKLIFSENLNGTKAKVGKEAEYNLTIKNISVLSKIIDFIESKEKEPDTL